MTIAPRVGDTIEMTTHVEDLKVIAVVHGEVEMQQRTVVVHHHEETGKTKERSGGGVEIGWVIEVKASGEILTVLPVVEGTEDNLMVLPPEDMWMKKALRLSIEGAEFSINCFCFFSVN